MQGKDAPEGDYLTQRNSESPESNDNTALAATSRQALLHDSLLPAAIDLRRPPENDRLPGLPEMHNPFESREQRLDSEIAKQPRDVQEWLDKMAKEIAKTGQIPDDMKRVLENIDPNASPIKLDWINRLLEKNGSANRIHLQEENGIRSLEIRRNDSHPQEPPLDRFDAPSQPRKPGAPPNGIFEEPTVPQRPSPQERSYPERIEFS